MVVACCDSLKEDCCFFLVAKEGSFKSKLHWSSNRKMEINATWLSNLCDSFGSNEFTCLTLENRSFIAVKEVILVATMIPAILVTVV